MFLDLLCLMSILVLVTFLAEKQALLISVLLVIISLAVSLRCSEPGVSTPAVLFALTCFTFIWARPLIAMSGSGFDITWIELFDGIPVSSAALHIYIRAVVVSMVVFASTLLCVCFGKSPTRFRRCVLVQTVRTVRTRSLAFWRYCFYLGAVFSVIQAFLYIRYFASGGSYYDLYLLGRDPVGFPGLSFLTSLLFFGYLGILSFSDSPQSLSPRWVAAFVFLSFLLLARGTRGEVFTQVLVAVWLYFFCKRKTVAIRGWLFLGSVLVVLAELVGHLREGVVAAGSQSASTILKWFVFSQGVSGELIAPAYEHFGVRLANIRFVVMPLLAPLHRVFDPAYGIQSAQSGMASGLLSDELTFRVARSFYLSGHGSGSSYLAEAFCAFGIVGVILSTAAITWLVRSAPLYARQSNNVQFVFAGMLPYVLFLPRESLVFFVVPGLKAAAMLLISQLV